jgi:hypothetical protein
MQMVATKAATAAKIGFCLRGRAVSKRFHPVMGSQDVRLLARQQLASSRRWKILGF